jgi:hypothetical protein
MAHHLHPIAAKRAASGCDTALSEREEEAL